MDQNIHRTAIPANVITDVEKAIDAQIDALKPYATPLTADERRELMKTGAKSDRFVRLANQFSKDNPKLLSDFFDQAAFDIDVQDTENLFSVENKALKLVETIMDTRMTAGSDSIHFAYEVLACVRFAYEHGVPEARAVFEQLDAARPNANRSHHTTTLPKGAF